MTPRPGEVQRLPTAVAFDLCLTGSLRRDAMEQRPEQALGAAGAELCQRHLDRPLATHPAACRGAKHPVHGTQ